MTTSPGANYYGSCPTCGQTDGYLNIPGGHVFVCDAHKTFWLVGSGLFTVEETDAELQANLVKIDGYTEVEPLPFVEAIEDEAKSVAVLMEQGYIHRIIVSDHLSDGWELVAWQDLPIGRWYVDAHNKRLIRLDERRVLFVVNNHKGFNIDISVEDGPTGRVVLFCHGCEAVDAEFQESVIRAIAGSLPPVDPPYVGDRHTESGEGNR